jgi:hypothetical protein
VAEATPRRVHLEEPHLPIPIRAAAQRHDQQVSARRQLVAFEHVCWVITADPPTRTLPLVPGSCRVFKSTSLRSGFA